MPSSGRVVPTLYLYVGCHAAKNYNVDTFVLKVVTIAVVDLARSLSINFVIAAILVAKFNAGRSIVNPSPVTMSVKRN